VAQPRFYEAVLQLNELLSETGSIYVHIGQNVSHYVKVVLDQVFGPDRYMNEIIWKRQAAHSDSKQGAQHNGRLHDLIYWYTKTEQYTWTQLYQPYDDTYLATFYSNIDATGRRFQWPSGKMASRLFEKGDLSDHHRADRHLAELAVISIFISLVGTVVAKKATEVVVMVYIGNSALSFEMVKSLLATTTIILSDVFLVLFLSLSGYYMEARKRSVFAELQRDVLDERHRDQQGGIP
jgi:hypothetical protein